MKSTVSRYATFLKSTALCLLISAMTISSAHAQFFFGFGLGLLCGPVNTGPTLVETVDGIKKVVISSTTTVLKKKVDGLNQLRHFVVVKLVGMDDSVVWTRPLQTQSLAIATVIPTMPPSYFITETLNIQDRPASPLFPFPGECLGVNLVTSNGNQFVGIALGTTAASGGTAVPSQTSGSGTQATGSNGTEAVVIGKDKTVVNIWMLNVNNGTIARTFRPRAKPGWYFLPNNSGIFDIDDDGNDELVLVRAKYIGEDRYDFMYETFNVSSGGLESTSTTNQNNKLIFQ